MNTEPVVDASVIVASVTQEKQSDWVEKQIQSYRYFHILDLTYYEVSNALKNKVREKKITNFQALECFNEAKKFMDLCKLHYYNEVIDDVMINVVNINATSYDLAYICLSRSLETKFITTDVKFAERLKGTDFYALIDFPK